ncbi:MAG: hypothetical protein D6702_03315 [Planctomycetota bacterium]|nr:MAG: hypothetical protein D6702_03315 [Planctomycetota bacterium]
MSLKSLGRPPLRRHGPGGGEGERRRPGAGGKRKGAAGPACPAGPAELQERTARMSLEAETGPPILPGMRARLLFVGDLHLGRRSGILPESLLERGLRPADLGPAAAWRLCCEQAIAEKVDAVVLAGDVVESREDRIEGWSQLEAGVGRLVAAGIPVVGVAGNHDGLVLPALADRIEGFRLLGRGGRWETIELVGPGGPFRLLGWSFPDQYVTASPLEDLPGDFLGDGPLLGVLHADLDQAGSRYAPVTRAALEATPVDAWFLGHVHAPSGWPGRARSATSARSAVWIRASRGPMGRGGSRSRRTAASRSSIGFWHRFAGSGSGSI